MTNKEWFQTARYGMMVHFGLYSILGGEWKGQRITKNTEWAQNKFKIPNREYEKLAKIFNPIYFDAEEWATTAKEAGMEYMVITSKHHDGFCLFQSDYDDYNCVDGSPFGRDIIAELSAACKKHGLKFGIYYSQDQDWHEPHGGGWLYAYWDNHWDYPEREKKNYALCFEGKIKTQMKELLTKYGQLDFVWCDNPTTMSPEQSLELYNMIRQYQPNCLVNSRIGNNVGDYESCGDNQTDFDAANSKRQLAENSSSWETAVGANTARYECPVTTSNSWGYAVDSVWKSPEELKASKDRLQARNISFLLNIGPDHLGRLPAPAVDIIMKMKEL